MCSQGRKCPEASKDSLLSKCFSKIYPNISITNISQDDILFMKPFQLIIRSHNYSFQDFQFQRQDLHLSSKPVVHLLKMYLFILTYLNIFRRQFYFRIYLITFQFYNTADLIDRPPISSSNSQLNIKCIHFKGS